MQTDVLSRQATEFSHRSPETQQVLTSVGSALHQQAAFQEAAIAFQQALALDPNHLAAWVGLGASLRRAGAAEDAVEAYRRALALAPTDLQLYLRLAHACLAAQDASSAVRTLRTALALAPGNAELWTVLGSSLTSLNEPEEAAACHRRALELDPDAHESRRELIRLRRGTTPPREVERLRQALADTTRPLDVRATAGFALGEHFDQQHAFDEAFSSFAAANHLSRQQRIAENAAFNAAAFHRTIQRLIDSFPAALFARTGGAGNPSAQPVFIVGMPRSGTSLVEQIVSSHSAVFGGGERTDIDRLIGAIGASISMQQGGFTRADLIRTHADAHIRRLDALSDGSARVTDKLPDNVLNLGYVAVLFPNARVILCLRDPRDVALSCFNTHFHQGLSWSNDLSDIAERIIGIERLVAHWRQVLPLPMLEVSYETLVANLEAEARRMIGFLDLPWEPACLDYRRNARAVGTASRWQVRQPLYTSSVGRWRHYHRHLQQLLDRLAGYLQPDA